VPHACGADMYSHAPAVVTCNGLQAERNVVRGVGVKALRVQRGRAGVQHVVVAVPNFSSLHVQLPRCMRPSSCTPLPQFHPASLQCCLH
jgi:hypothetical protein